MKLTPSEESIVRLVIKGESNQEIAQKLFVTEKTVKFHLTNIYAKLGVQSRASVNRYVFNG
jgi:DNA-binding NarL/FixJ family response regulator